MMAAGPANADKPEKQRIELGKKFFNEGPEYRTFFKSVKDFCRKTLPKPEHFTKIPHVWEFNLKLEKRMTNRAVDKDDHKFKDKLKQIEVGKFTEGFKKTIEVPRILYFKMLPKEQRPKKGNNVAEAVAESIEGKAEAPSGMRVFVPVFEMIKVEVVAYNGDVLAFTDEEMSNWELNAAYMDPPWGLNPDLPYDKKAFSGAEVIRLLKYTFQYLVHI